LPTIWERLTRRTQTEEKASTNLRSGTYYTELPQAVYTPHDYGRIAKEGYQHNVWAYACVREITNAAKDTPIKLFEVQSNGDRVEVPDHPMMQLLRNPLGDTPSHPVTWESFLEASIAYLLISGNYYIYKQKPETRNGPPRRLYTLRPDKTTMRPDGSHEYGEGTSKRIFPAGEVLHGSLFHPLDDTYGLGVIEAASRGIDMFNAAQSHNVKLLQNGARPSSAWIAEGELTDEQFERMREQMMRYEGPDNTGKQLLLEAGIKWQDLSLSPHEMDWLEGINNAARQIHAAFGVHPVLTGLQEGTFENQRMAMRGLYMGAVLPVMRHILTDLTKFLQPDYGDNLVLEVDRDSIEALSEDRDSLYTRVTNAYETGVLTRNEARLALGFDEVTGGDSFNPLVTLSQEAPEKKSVERAEHYKRFDRDLTRREARAETKFREALTAQRARLMDALEGGTLDTISRTIQSTYDNRELRAALEEEILAAMVEEGRETTGQLKGVGPAEVKQFEEVFGIMSETALLEAQERAAFAVKQTTETQRAAINKITADAIAEGAAIETVVGRVDDLMLDQIIPNRSRAIARTEVVGASNRGAQLAAEGTGLKLNKTWLATPFGDLRENHWALNGTTVGRDELFPVGGGMLHPHAPGAPAGEVINCRCTHRFEVA